MNKKIIMGIIIFILLLTPVGYFITKTGWYENYRQAQFLAAVINNTKNLETYHVSLNVNYDILGYQMELSSEGDVSQSDSTVSHLNYLIRMNGYGVSPMTVELEQYAQWSAQNKILYMNLNRGQWFKEIDPTSDKYYQYFVDFNNLDYLNQIYKETVKNENANDFVILEDNNEQQVISVYVDFLKADQMIQILIGELLNVSPDIDINAIYQLAPKVNYIFTIDKETERVLEYELSYKDGMQEIIKQLQTAYSSFFATISEDRLATMYFDLKVKISDGNKGNKIEIPSNVVNSAISVSDIR